MSGIMKCGHAANATDAKTGKPVCAICMGINPGADQPADEPDLTDRMAVCGQCKYKPRSTEPSKLSLPFFQHRPKSETDIYYCGCWGWD